MYVLPTRTRDGASTTPWSAAPLLSSSVVLAPCNVMPSGPTGCSKSGVGTIGGSAICQRYHYNGRTVNAHLYCRRYRRDRQRYHPLYIASAEAFGCIDPVVDSPLCTPRSVAHRHCSLKHRWHRPGIVDRTGGSPLASTDPILILRWRRQRNASWYLVAL